MLIPWTPRTVWRTPKPEVQADPDSLCERTIGILQPIVFKALKPYPEARRALYLALRKFAGSTLR